MRVVIAEDSFLVREGMRRLLQESGEVDVVAVTGNATELLEAVDRLLPDAVITDIRMPPGHHLEGIEAAHEVRRRHPGIGVVVLSQHVDEAYAFELLKDGASGLAYLLKDHVGQVEEMLDALRAVNANRSVVDPIVIEKLVSGRARADTSPLRTLSPRELDVLREMARGRTNAAIGGALGVAESSVEKYANAVFSKLGLGEEEVVHRRVAAVLTFLREQGRRDLSGAGTSQDKP